MITTNTDKKALIEKLFTDKKITLDEMIQLLTEPDHIPVSDWPAIVYPQYPMWPAYPYGGGWWGIIPPAPVSPYVWPGGTITVNTGIPYTVSYPSTCTETILTTDTYPVVSFTCSSN